jgi:bifunctional DNase/RNase
MLHKAKIEGIALDKSNSQPVIILKTEDGEQTIPIWVGVLEATSIASALNGVNFDRPMTHDLFKNFMGLLDIHVSQVDICDLKDNTYYAKIHFLAKDDTFAMDARSSDAIAMAIRFDAPIYIDDDVIRKSQAVIERNKAQDKDAEVLDTSEDGEKWAEYLKKLDPEDFGKYKV